MADASFLQHAFLGGEWSKRMQGRIDRPDYRTAMNVCLNGFPDETGAWVRRPGSRHVCATLLGQAARIISFTFEESAPYLMEFTNQRVRFITSVRPEFELTGPRLATAAGEALVTNISTANPAVMTIDADQGWQTETEIYVANLGTVCPTLQGRTVFLTRLTPTTYSMTDGVTNQAIDGTTLGWVAGTQAVALQIIIPATDFTTAMLPVLRCVQTEGTALLLSGTLPIKAITVATPPKSNADATFNYITPALLDGPYLDPFLGNSENGNVPISTYSIAGNSITFTTGGWTPGFKSTDVGRLVRFFFEPSDWDGGAVYGTPGARVKWNGSYWALNTGGSGNQGAPGSSSNWSPVTNVAIWTWATITAINSSSQAVATFANNAPGIPSQQSPATYVCNTWRLGVYSQTTGWPTCGTYHEGRVWLSGAAPNRFDSSVSNGVSADGTTIDMSPTDQYGNVLDSSAISYTLNAPDSNPIFWMIPDLQGIICGTLAGEWLVQSPTTGGLTPTNIAARRVTTIGCANIEPRRTEHTVMFVQKFQRKVMEYFADVFSGKFTAPHITFTCKHLTIGGLDEIAYQQELSPTVWMRVNGGLASITYKRDTLMTSSGPTIAAGARHALGSGRTVTSICVGPSDAGTLDALSLVTQDPATGVYHVELMTDILEEGAPYASAWFLDDAVQPTSVVSSTTASPGAPSGGLTINGLWHHNGKTVSVHSGGLDCGTFTVANGSVFVPYGDGVSVGAGGGLFTPQQALAASAAGQIIVGFAYDSDGQIVRPVAPQETGARNGPALGKLKRIHRYAIQIENSAGMKVGTDFTKLEPVLFKNYAGRAMGPTATFTGVYRSELHDDNSLDAMFAWRVTGPYPGNVAALECFLHCQDQ